MIHPGVAIGGCDPAAMAWVNRVLRDPAPRTEVSIVLRDGVVAQVAGDTDGSVAVGDAVDDPAALAAGVRRATGADQVTVLDRAIERQLSAQVVELARSCRSQGELLWRARQLWNSHDGVAIDPPPGAPRWREIAGFLASVPDGGWLVVAAHDGDRTLLLAACVEDGLIVRITSDVPPDADVVLRIDATTDELATLLHAKDPLDQLGQLGRIGATWSGFSADRVDL